MASPTIAAGIARGLLDLAVAEGASRGVLLERCGIDPDQLRDPDQRIPFASYVALMRAGQALSRDPALALHFGEAFDMAEMSIVGLLCSCSETASEAFAQLNRYERLVADVDGVAAGPRHVLERRAGRTWLVDTRRNPNDFPELTESNFARMVCMSRRMPGDVRFIEAVHVTHAAPAYRAEYSRIFQVPVTFDSDRNALLLTDGAWLDTRIPQAPSSRYVFDVLGERARNLLDNLERSTSTRGRIESLLIPILHTGEVSVERIAGILGLSRQTLFRQLKAEGTTFRKTLDELRHKMALSYLGGNKVSVNQTAYLVGFSDPAAFSRAFKRWTGSSPRAMRRKGKSDRAS
jgi:AraC-like DNA-binding protein